MKLATVPSPVERHGESESESDFTIKATPKAFSILVSKLYKDKITAIIREISCNAYDSHVAAGHPDKPFDVHLPNSGEPNLIIRDYGTGLSDSDVRTVFTAFFESTKENTNDQIGALGLGCKSPFSYTDTYTVKSFFGGSRSRWCATYVCFMENLLPKISRVSRIRSKEPVGLEVSIPINPSDFSTFRQKAGEVYRWFAVKPTVKGMTQFDIPPVSAPARFGKGWEYFPANHRGKVSLAVMGNVAYPLDSGVLSTHLTEFEKKLLDYFVFSFAIGELDVQAGREELSYDRRTIAAIKKRLGMVCRQLSATTQYLFAECENAIQAARRVLELEDTHLFNLAPPRWNGSIITGSCPPPLKGKLWVRTHKRLRNAYPSRRRYGATITRVLPTAAIEPWPSVIIFVDDLKRGGGSRFKKFSAACPSPCYFFQPDEATAEETLAAFSDFEDVRLISSIKTERALSKIKQFDSRAALGKEGMHRKNHKPVEVDLDLGGVYVPSRSNVIQSENGELSFSELREYISVYADIQGGSIYVVPWQSRKEFMAHPDWQTLYSFVNERLSAKLTDPEFVREIHAEKDRQTFSMPLYDRVQQIANLLPKNHAFHKFVARHSEQISAKTKPWYRLIHYILNNPTLWPDHPKFFDGRSLKLRHLWKSLDNMPLLKAIASNAVLDSEALADLAQYAKTKA